MRWHDMDGGNWLWMSGMMLVFIAMVVAIMILGFGRTGRTSPPTHTPDEVLHQRLASGEIDIDEFHRRLEALKGARVG